VFKEVDEAEYQAGPDERGGKMRVIPTGRRLDEEGKGKGGE
jgi:hypothetical protein